MARTIAQIYNAIIVAKETQTPLAALAPSNDTYQQLFVDMTSSSKVAIWRLLAYIVASAIWTHETLWDLFRIEIDTKIANGVWGTVRWYQQQAFKFQYGDMLTYNTATSHYEYATIDTTKQIIKRCSIIEDTNSTLIVKVAKLDPNLIALTQSEKTAFVSYLKKIKFAGTAINVVTGNGDLLRIELDISYDAIIPLNDIQTNVEAAINSYIGNLPFDGQFRVINLIDAIQTVQGVTDVLSPTNGIETRLSLTAPWLPISQNHTPTYGYYLIDNSFGNSLASTINYYAI
jgi:hypothetical protein